MCSHFHIHSSSASSHSSYIIQSLTGTYPDWDDVLVVEPPVQRSQRDDLSRVIVQLEVDHSIVGVSWNKRTITDNCVTMAVCITYTIRDLNSDVYGALYMYCTHCTHIVHTLDILYILYTYCTYSTHIVHTLHTLYILYTYCTYSTHIVHTLHILYILYT